MIASGARSSAVLTTQGNVYTWGAYECLGRALPGEESKKGAKRDGLERKKLDSSVPYMVDFFSKQKGRPSRLLVNYIVCGDMHVCCVAASCNFNDRDELELYAWGNNAYGQLGIRETGLKMSGRPRRVDVPEIVCTKDLFKKTALEPTKSCANSAVLPKNAPNAVKGLSHMALISGGRHMLFLFDGALYLWGSNKFGQLGLGANQSDAVVKQPTRLNYSLFSPYSAEPPVIRSLCAGNRYTCASTTTGKVYFWGSCEFIQSMTKFASLDAISSPRATHNTGGQFTNDTNCAFSPQLLQLDTNLTSSSVSSISNSAISLLTVHGTTREIHRELDFDGMHTLSPIKSSMRTPMYTSQSKKRVTLTHETVLTPNSRVDMSKPRQTKAALNTRGPEAITAAQEKAKQVTLRAKEAISASHMKCHSDRGDWTTGSKVVKGKRDATVAPMLPSHHASMRNIMDQNHITQKAKADEVMQAFKEAKVSGAITHKRVVQNTKMVAAQEKLQRRLSLRATYEDKDNLSVTSGISRHSTRSRASMNHSTLLAEKIRREKEEKEKMITLEGMRALLNSVPHQPYDPQVDTKRASYKAFSTVRHARQRGLGMPKEDKKLLSSLNLDSLGHHGADPDDPFSLFSEAREGGEHGSDSAFMSYVDEMIENPEGKFSDHSDDEPPANSSGFEKSTGNIRKLRKKAFTRSKQFDLAQSMPILDAEVDVNAYLAALKQERDNLNSGAVACKRMNEDLADKVSKSNKLFSPVRASKSQPREAQHTIQLSEMQALSGQIERILFD